MKVKRIKEIFNGGWIKKESIVSVFLHSASSTGPKREEKYSALITTSVLEFYEGVAINEQWVKGETKNKEEAQALVDELIAWVAE